MEANLDLRSEGGGDRREGLALAIIPRKVSSRLLVEATYTYTTCHPTKSEVVTYDAELSEAQVRELSEQYPWEPELATADGLAQTDVHYSPSEIVRLGPIHEALTFSAVEGIAGLSFYVFYVNPAEQVRSGEEQIEESRHYFELFLAGQIDVLVGALKDSERVF